MIHRGTGVVAALAIALVIAVVGCSGGSGAAATSDASVDGSKPSPSDAGVIDGATDANQVDADIPAGNGEWSCLGKVTLPSPAGATSTITFMAGSVQGGVVANLGVRACPNAEDESCIVGTTTQTTDASGSATLNGVPLGTKGFNGYFEAVEAGDATNLHFVPNAILKTTALHDRVQWRYAELKILMDAIGITPDYKKGQVLIQTQDCRSKALPNNELAMSPLVGGVSLTLNPMPAGVVRAYVTLKPSVTVSTTAMATADDYGGGGFLNVPPGVYTVTGRVAKTGERVGEQRIHVRAAAHSLVILAPTP